MDVQFPSLAPKIGRFEFKRNPGAFIDNDSQCGDTFDLASPSLGHHASIRLSAKTIPKVLCDCTEEPAPNGGILAWTQVFTAFLLVMNGFGYINSFGVFQETYAEMLDRDASSISFVGSFQIFLLFFVGTLSGRALDAGYFRFLLVAGCSMQVLGIFATASATRYWQLFLAQGIVQGLGNGMLFTPLVWLVSIYFTSRRGLALGLASCGAPVGGTLFTLVARQLLVKVGFAWTVRVMGFTVLVNSALILSLTRPRVVKRIKGPFLDLAAFKDKRFLFYSISTFFAILGLYWAPFYIAVFVRSTLHASSATSLEALLILNGVGITGRLIRPALADRYYGPLRTLTVCTLLSALFIYWWIAVHSVTGVMVWCAFYAFWTNAVQTLLTACIGSLTADFSKLGVRIGMVFTIVGVAALAGPPIAGVLIQSQAGEFLYAQILGGTSMMLGFGFMALACILQLRT